jgi:hypothetical protein
VLDIVEVHEALLSVAVELLVSVVLERVVVKLVVLLSVVLDIVVVSVVLLTVVVVMFHVSPSSSNSVSVISTTSVTS